MSPQTLALAVLLLLFPAELPAQTVTLGSVQPGTRVRLTADCVAGYAQPGRAPSPNRWDRPEWCFRYDATLLRVSTDSVVIVEDERQRAVAVADIRRLQVRTGRRRNWGRGAAIGAGAGLVWGLASAVATECSGGFLQDLCETSRLASPFIGAALGAGLGGLIGGLTRSDRWEVVSFRVAGAGFPGGARGAGVGVAIGF